MRVALLGAGPIFHRVLAALTRAGCDVVAFDSDPGAVSVNGHGADAVEWAHSLDELAGQRWDLCFACDFHRLLPAEFASTRTVLNCHGGLLPRYRGYHGNGWAFINGEAEIGYTIHRVDATLDGGPIIYQSRVPVTDDATFGQLKARLMDDLVERLPGVLRAYRDGALPERPQDIRDATFVARRHPRDCYIEWDRSSEHVERFVRALAPPAAPGAFTVFRDRKLVILSAELYATVPYREIPGHVVYRLEGRGVLVKTGDGVLLVKEVEYDGRTVAALDLFPTTGYRLGLDLVGERLESLGIA